MRGFGRKLSCWRAGGRALHLPAAHGADLAPEHWHRGRPPLRLAILHRLPGRARAVPGPSRSAAGAPPLLERQDLQNLTHVRQVGILSGRWIVSDPRSQDAGCLLLFMVSNLPWKFANGRSADETRLPPSPPLWMGSGPAVIADHGAAFAGSAPLFEIIRNGVKRVCKLYDVSEGIDSL